MPEKMADRTYVLRGEFLEFREEVRGSLAEVARTLKAVPNKEDMASAIRGEIGVSRQISPAMVAVALSFVALIGALYSRDQDATDRRLADYKSTTNQRISGNEDRIGWLRDMMLENRERIGASDVRSEYVEKMVREHREDRKADLAAIEERFDKRTREEAEARNALDTMLQREARLLDEIDRLTAEVRRLGDGNGGLLHRGSPP